jgi:hypothetical protein
LPAAATTADGAGERFDFLQALSLGSAAGNDIADGMMIGTIG